MSGGPQVLLDAVHAKLLEVDAMCGQGRLTWSDYDEALLTAWREARGEEGKTSTWEWWSKLGSEDDFQWSGSTREGVIRQAQAQYPGKRLTVVEARYWTDTFHVEDGRFAEVRNRESIPANAQVRDPA